MITKAPLVTVFTATYMNFDHLEQTVKSVFSQTYPNIEYIITDDGSTAFPTEKLNDLINREKPQSIECRIIRRETNVGTVRNMNEAYRLSKGIYLINLSCGDVFFDNTVIEQIVDRFILTKCDVLVTSRVLYSGDFEPICLLPHFEERNIIRNYKKGIDQYKAFIAGRFYDMASGSAMCFTKSIMERMNYYDERYVLWEDGPFLAKYLQVGKLECAYDIISIWYETGGVSDKHKTKNKLNAAQTQLQKDARRFENEEKTARLELFNYRERRLIRYHKYRERCSNSFIRYLLYILYFPEMVSNLIYTKKRRSRIISDQIEIDRIIRKRGNRQ